MPPQVDSSTNCFRIPAPSPGSAEICRLPDLNLFLNGATGDYSAQRGNEYSAVKEWILMERRTQGKTQDPDVKRRCHRCHGSGRSPCQICNGAGQVATGKDVYGKAKYSNCGGCFGLKVSRCSTCNGEGFVS